MYVLVLNSVLKAQMGLIFLVVEVMGARASKLSTHEIAINSFCKIIPRIFFPASFLFFKHTCFSKLSPPNTHTAKLSPSVELTSQQCKSLFKNVCVCLKL